MADVSGKFFSAVKVRTGVSPSSPGSLVGEPLEPVNPPGAGLSSVGITMPSAFAVANSPLTSNGTIQITGAGTISQYVRGDGTLETFPSLTGFVPYTGATQNVDLGEFGVDAGFVQLDTTPTNTPTSQGTIFWDVDDETVDVVLNGYIMKIGEDQFYPVKNQTGSSIAKGTAVRFAGTLGASGRLLIAPFIADGSVSSSFFMGVTAEAIADGADGKVLYFGRIRGINTNAFNEGDVLYASTTVAGGFQTAVPVAPNNIVQVAAVINKSINQGVIFIRPSFGSNINQDEGVKIVSPTTGQLLQLQANGLWENKTTAQVLGGTSSQFVKGDGTLDSNTYQVTSEKGQPNGYASLDSNGKVPLVQINDALIGNVNFQGLWNASTNTPTLANPPASGTKGHYYIVSTAGTFAGISFEVGDWIISDGTAWGKVDNTDAVSSIFGRTGNVVAANGDYTTAQVTESGNLYYTDGRARGSLSFVAGSGAYNSTTGVITIPTNNNQITNGAGYITSAALSGYLPLIGGTMTGVITTPNGTFGIIVGDDSRLADRNVANTLFLEGVQNNDRAYINFSETTGNALGAINGGNLTWRGDIVLNSANFNSYAPTLTGGGASGTWGINITGNSTSVINTVTGTNSAELVRGNMADNDHFRILVGGTASNAGFAEIATADDGTEPIFVRQYTGVFSTLIRTATLLDGSGNTSFPGSITGNSIIRSGGTSSQYLMADGSVSTLTNPITGSGDINTVSKFTGGTTIGNSQITDNGTSVSIGSVTTFGKLNVTNGNAHLNIYFSTLSSAGWDSNLYVRAGNSNGVSSLNLGYIGSDNDAYIKRNSDGRLSLGTSQNDRLSIFLGGNVLVGTGSNAGFKLDVNGTGRFSGNLTANGAKPQLYVSGDSSAGAGIHLTTALSGTNRRNWGIFTEENVDGDFAIKCSSAAGGSPGSGNTRLQITRDGNVGIGTNSPSSMLHLYNSGVGTQLRIQSDLDQAGLRLISGTGSTNRASRIDFLNGVASTTVPRWSLISDYNQDGTNDLSFVTQNPSVRAIILTQSGNVLIGTTNNNSNSDRLVVNGVGYFEQGVRTGIQNYLSGLWKFGRGVSGTQPTNTHQLIVEIDGQPYVIPAALL